MATIYLALGSNVGDSAAYIQKAIQLLGSTLSNMQQAPVYAAKPMGYTEQADFLNTAISGQTDVSPEELLATIKDIEQEVGRVERFHWGPREIDIDLIFYGDLIRNTDQLSIPHPHFQERDFVLQPLADLNASLVDPLSGKTMRQLIDELPEDHISLIKVVGK
jgi:2-amino-4-hydroxy-6-hydroxymethyldihydropteridine diphosphokinase